MAKQPRERWTNRTAFIMAAVGSAVGLGNLWRFPAVAFGNGGGAFFIPYFVALLTAGVPLMIVEYAIGQKYQGGAPQALAAVTSKFRWVGWFALLVGCSITTYYCVVMAYAWNFAAGSFTRAWSRPVAYSAPAEEDGVPVLKHFPAEEVRLYVPMPRVGPAEGESAAEARDRAEELRAWLGKVNEGLPVLTEEELALREQQDPEVHYVSIVGNVGHYLFEQILGGYHEDYWRQARAHNERLKERRIVAEAGDLPPPEGEVIAYADEMFRLSPNLVVGAVLTWVMIFLIIFKGVRNVGRVVMLTVPLPVILLLMLLLRGLTLPGASEGLVFYLRPNWEMLKAPSVWIAAYGQIFFSLSLGFGILIAYASYMPPESDVTNSAFITSFGNCATSFIAGLAVFSVLGYLAYIGNTTVGGLPESGLKIGGPLLVFFTYPVALSQMPLAAAGLVLVSLAFFLCLITLGIDSAFSLVEGIVTGFRDRFARVSRPAMSGVFCLIGLAGSLLFCTRSGLIWLDIVDNWMSNYGLPFVGLMECIAVGYFFHLEELKDYINAHSELKVHNWFDACIKFVTPAILIYLLADQFIANVTSTYGGYDAVLAHAVTFAGWGWFLAILVIALLLARHYVAIGWLGCAVALGAGAFQYLQAKVDPAKVGASEVLGAAVMGALAATILFGALAFCIYVAVRTHHMAGLSLEAVEPQEGETPEP